jgi:hypothetical protein
LQSYEIPLSRVDVGVFALTYGVPSIPFVLKRAYIVEVVATTSAGATFSVGVPVIVR